MKKSANNVIDISSNVIDMKAWRDKKPNPTATISFGREAAAAYLGIPVEDLDKAVKDGIISKPYTDIPDKLGIPVWIQSELDIAFSALPNAAPAVISTISKDTIDPSKIYDADDLRSMTHEFFIEDWMGMLETCMEEDYGVSVGGPKVKSAMDAIETILHG